MSFEQTGRPAKPGTLLQMISRYGLHIECSACAHASVIPVSAFIAALGNGATVKDAIAHIKCSKCYAKTPRNPIIVLPAQTGCYKPITTP